MNLNIIIPAYNEEETIGDVIKNIQKSCKAYKPTIIVVDDGSTDRTGEISRKLKATVIRHTSNKGVGKAFFSGIEAALKNKPDIIVNMDGDGQFNPQDIPLLILPIQKGKADMVTCTRHPYKGLPLMKKLGNKIFTKMTSSLTGQKFTDTQCGFRAYSYKAAMALNLFGEFTYTQEAFLDLANKGFKIMEIPLNVRPQRKHGKSKVVKNIWSYGTRALIIIGRTFRDNMPLKFFGIPALSLLFAGLALFGFLIIKHLIGDDIADHTAILISSIAIILFGFLMFILALIADMFDKSYKNQERILLNLKEMKYK